SWGWLRGQVCTFNFGQPHRSSQLHTKVKGTNLTPKSYFPPRMSCLKSSPGPGFGPIHVFRIASETALPPSVPFTFPFTSTVVPTPGTYVSVIRWPLFMSSIHDESVRNAVFT